MAQVTSRYAMKANIIHTWLKDPRFTPVLRGRMMLYLRKVPLPSGPLVSGS